MTVGRLMTGFALSLFLAASAFGQPSGQTQSKPTPKPEPGGTADGYHLQTLDGRHRSDARAPHDPRVGALQAGSLTSTTKGANAASPPTTCATSSAGSTRNTRRSSATPAGRSVRPHDPGQVAPGACRGEGGHRHRKPDGHGERLKPWISPLAAGSARHEGGGRHRANVAGDRLHG